jgi:hypothetical protein
MRVQRMSGIIDTARTGGIIFRENDFAAGTNRSRPTRNRAGWNAMIRGVEL